jgi:hypothetical protein
MKVEFNFVVIFNLGMTVLDAQHCDAGTQILTTIML